MKHSDLSNMTLADAERIIEEWAAKTMGAGGFVAVVRASWLMLEEVRRLRGRAARTEQEEER